MATVVDDAGLCKCKLSEWLDIHTAGSCVGSRDAASMDSLASAHLLPLPTGLMFADSVLHIQHTLFSFL